MLDWVWFFTRTLNFSACLVWLDFLGTGFLGLVVVIIQKDLYYSWWNCFVTFWHLILQSAYRFRVMRIGWEEDEESTHNERMSIDQLSLHSRPVKGGGLQKFYLYFKNFASYHHFKTTWGLLLIWINLSFSPMLYKLKETWPHLRKKTTTTTWICLCQSICVQHSGFQFFFFLLVLLHPVSTFSPCLRYRAGVAKTSGHFR